MKPYPIPSSLQALLENLWRLGAEPVLVGGGVRDHLLGLAAHDIDIEVYGLAYEKLKEILALHGAVHLVGESFSVLKVILPGLGTLDISIPRRESKHSPGHTGFLVSADSTMTFEEAARRRDFTINAMGIRLSTQELLDPYQGAQDLENHILRHVSPAFSEDPLRVLRACQLASRFRLSLAPQTIGECHKLTHELSTLPLERIYPEIQKMLLGQAPSMGLETMLQTNAISLFPELSSLIGCEQDPIWHPEGDVWVHTLLVVDQAAQIIRREQLDGEEAFIILLGALCHDLGKPATTKREDNRLRSKGHETAGESPTRSLLQRFGVPQGVIEAVVPLVREHLKPYQFYATRDEITDSAIRRLAQRVHIRHLTWVAEADFFGRTLPENTNGFELATCWLLEQARRLDVADSASKPILMGRHLISLGMEPGAQMGEILTQAYEAQLDGAFNNTQEGLEWLKNVLLFPSALKPFEKPSGP